MTTEDDVAIKIVDAWPADELVELYKAGGWWKPSYDSSQIPKLIKGSFAFAVAVSKRTGRAVGMGRCLSDGVSDAWIQDVAVLPPYRNRGIGRSIIKELLDYCLERRLQWIGLVAEPGTRDFYIPLGFRALPGEPMVHQPEE
jgi:GNAT superfamily N-acetyltransferase